MTPNLDKGTISISVQGNGVAPFPVSYICWGPGVRNRKSDLKRVVRSCKVNVFKQQQLVRENLSIISIVLVTVLFAKEVVEA